MIVIAQSSGTNLRVYEEEKLEEIFNGRIICSPDDVKNVVRGNRAEYVYWRPNTEATTKIEWNNYCKYEDEIAHLECSWPPQVAHPKTKFINSVKSFPAAQSKEVAFLKWKMNNIPCPDFFIYKNRVDFKEQLERSEIDYPFFIRTNNCNSGYETYLVRDSSDLPRALGNVQNHLIHPTFKGGIKTQMMCVKHIDTIEDGCNYSYRIIVAGNQVITGYARVSRGTDWNAITKKFSLDMADKWVHYNQKCQKFILQNWDEILKAVHVLGLNFQGVDVIIDAKTQKHYFLEVQPGFSVGYANREAAGWLPPFYNPSKPPELVQFLKDNLEDLTRQIPMYCKYWLKKDRLFHHSFTALKNCLDGVQEERLHKTMPRKENVRTESDSDI